MKFHKQFFTAALLSVNAAIAFGQTQHKLLPDQQITFSILNAGVEVEGTMKVVKGEIIMGSQDGNHIHVTADASTVNTGMGIRDKHLRRSDYFDVTSFPSITMRSTKLNMRGSTMRAVFNLTIKNITRPVEFTLRKTRHGKFVVYEGSFEINRLDFGLGEKSVILDDVVRIRFSLSAH